MLTDPEACEPSPNIVNQIIFTPNSGLVVPDLLAFQLVVLGFNSPADPRDIRRGSGDQLGPGESFIVPIAAVTVVPCTVTGNDKAFWVGDNRLYLIASCGGG